MIDFLLGVPGKLKTISDWLSTNLSAVRTAKIENLDALISSRAAAATAVPIATHNADVAALSASILTRMAGIKAIYTGAITITVTNQSGDVTIPAVNLSKTLCFLNGFNSSDAYLLGHPMVYLASATQLTASVRNAVSGASTVVRYTVVEFL